MCFSILGAPRWIHDSRCRVLAILIIGSKSAVKRLLSVSIPGKKKHGARTRPLLESLARLSDIPWKLPHPMCGVAEICPVYPSIGGYAWCNVCLDVASVFLPFGSSARQTPR